MLWYSTMFRDWDVTNGTAPKNVSRMTECFALYGDCLLHSTGKAVLSCCCIRARGAQVQADPAQRCVMLAVGALSCCRW